MKEVLNVQHCYLYVTFHLHVSLILGAISLIFVCCLTQIKLMALTGLGAILSKGVWIRLGGETSDARQQNSCGVIPKLHQPGKSTCLPLGGSVWTTAIPLELCSLSYASVDEAEQCIMGYSRGALLAKLDIENAYQIIPSTRMIVLCLGWCGKKVCM